MRASSRRAPVADAAAAHGGSAADGAAAAAAAAAARSGGSRRSAPVRRSKAAGAAGAAGAAAWPGGADRRPSPGAGHESPQRSPPSFSFRRWSRFQLTCASSPLLGGVMLDHHLIKSAYTAGSWLVHKSMERTPAEEYED